MIQLTFQSDGKIQVYANTNGESIMVTACINNLQAMLPANTFDMLRSRVIAFVEATEQSKRIK